MHVETANPLLLAITPAFTLCCRQTMACARCLVERNKTLCSLKRKASAAMMLWQYVIISNIMSNIISSDIILTCLKCLESNLWGSIWIECVFQTQILLISCVEVMLWIPCSQPTLHGSFCKNVEKDGCYPSSLCCLHGRTQSPVCLKWHRKGKWKQEPSAAYIRTPKPFPQPSLPDTSIVFYFTSILDLSQVSQNHTSPSDIVSLHHHQSMEVCRISSPVSVPATEDPTGPLWMSQDSFSCSLSRRELGSSTRTISGSPSNATLCLALPQQILRSYTGISLGAGVQPKA